MMTFVEKTVTVITAGAANMLCRFLPFVLFPEKSETPGYIRYLGSTLPPAVFGMLVVYCLRDVSIASGSHGLPELIAVLVTGFLHIKRRQMILSVAGGTIIYMLLVQLVF